MPTLQPWRTVELRRKQLHDISTRRIIAAQLYTIIIAGLAGYLLNESKELFVLVGGALVLYPGITDLTSSNATSLSAHIHHDFDASPETSKLRIILTNFIASIGITIAAAAVVGTFAGLISNILFATSFWNVWLLAVTAGAMIGLLGYPVIIVATMALRRRRSNPDDVIAPVESSIIGAASVIVIIFLSGIIQ